MFIFFKKKEKESNIYYEVEKALTIANESGLTVEIVVESMNYLKNNPKKTIKEALNRGLAEWIK
jgi:hypothetical protein